MLKKISLYSFFIIVCAAHLSFAQDSDRDRFMGLIVYGELAGAAGDYSLNVEYAFAQIDNIKFSARAGFGAAKFPTYDEQTRDFVGIPVGVQAFTFLNSSSHLEVGAGVSYLKGRNPGSSPYEMSNKSLVFSPNVGYRFQRLEGGFFMRVSYTPYVMLKEFTSVPISSDPKYQNFSHWFGLSFGYFFKAKK